MSSVKSINPATGLVIKEYERIDDKTVVQKLEKANQAYQTWKQTSFEERAKLMHKLADIFEENKMEYATLATQEMGKVIKQSISEIEKCAWVCRHYADNAEAYLKEEHVETDAHKSYVVFQPMGVLLAVMPWNFPFYQVIRFIVPAVMAGNTGVLKHASNVQGCAFALEKAFSKAGFPDNIFVNLNILSDQVKSVIDHKAIVAVTLTGSEPAGRAVASIAAKNLKKSVLELGGSDAYIILDDIDINEAVEQATIGRLQNNGQTCIAAKRFVVLEKIYDAFLEAYKERMSSVDMGNPMEKETYLGPMAREDLRDELHDQVEKSIEQGAKLVLGGEIPDKKGAYYPATILADVQPGMEAFNEELFGPVASVIKAKDINEAIALANNSSFGLGAGVITNNKKLGESIALQLEAGNCFVNTLVKSDPRLPFGGVKNSGYGRELSSYGIKEFMNTKTVWVQ